MAAPQVAGVAALLHQIVPNLTPDEYINIMTATAQDIEQPGFDVASGNGLINPVSALQYASNNNSQGMYTPKTMKMKIKSPKKIKAGKRFTMKGAVSSGETPIISQFVRITYVVKISSKKKTYISEEKPFAVVESNTSGSFSLPTKIKTKTIFTAYVDNPVPPYATPKPVLWKVKTKK